MLLINKWRGHKINRQRSINPFKLRVHNKIKIIHLKKNQSLKIQEE